MMDSRSISDDILEMSLDEGSDHNAVMTGAPAGEVEKVESLQEGETNSRINNKAETMCADDDNERIIGVPNYTIRASEQWDIFANEATRIRDCWFDANSL